MTDKKKRAYEEDNDDNDDIDQLINRINFNRQLANGYKQRDQQYKQRLEFLKAQLKNLNSGKLEGYKQKLNEIEADYGDRMATIKLWYQIKKSEIEYQFDLEQKTTQQEYQEKRKELKDSLKHEYEEKKRQVENEKQALDINLDSNEVKPTVTRKLRRRGNQTQTNPNHSNDLQFTSLLLNSSIITPNTSQIQLNNCTLTLTSSTQHTQNTLSIQNIVNATQDQQRKRRPSPSTQILCTLNDDEICDDLKYLSKNSNLLPAQILSVFNSMQQTDIAAN